MLGFANDAPTVTCHIIAMLLGVWLEKRQELLFYIFTYFNNICNQNVELLKFGKAIFGAKYGNPFSKRHNLGKWGIGKWDAKGKI